MEIQSGLILRSRYRIQRTLGKGGMGAVYLADDLTLNIQVAVKQNRTLTDENTEQFLREARLLARLHHPNLPRVIDYFTMEDNQYLVMDYIPGNDLGMIYENEGAQPLESVTKWVDQLAGALSYLHNQNPPVIHRDIKPANIKLMPSGEVILVDFGIAKASDSSQATAAGASGYTPGFAPPEQYGRARTGGYSDQFSLAATIYTLLTAQMPEDSVQRALNKAVLTPIDLLTPGIPEHIKCALERAMSLKPEDRFPSIEEFIKAFKDPTYEAPHTTIPLQPKTKQKEQKSGMKLILFGSLGALVVLFMGSILFLSRIFNNNNLSLFNLKSSITPSPLMEIQASATEDQNAQIPLQPGNTLTPTLPALDVQLTPSQTNTPEPRQIGGLLAFVSDRVDGQTLQIWTMKVGLDNLGNIVTYDLSQVTSDPGDKSQPAWSHDGSKLVYVASVDDGKTLSSVGKELWLLDLSDPNTAPLNLTNLRGDDFDPEWSPDDSKIVFTNQGRYNDTRQLYTIDADGSNLLRLSHDYEEYSATWSPDMEWIMFVMKASGHDYLNRRGMKTVNTIDPIPTPERYDMSTVFGRLGQVTDPAWSPDGNYIAYTRIEGVTNRIYSVEYKSRGNDINLLAGETYKDKEPAWSPDSQWIAFTSERDGNPEIYIMKATGSWQTNLTQFMGKDMQPAWQP